MSATRNPAWRRITLAALVSLWLALLCAALLEPPACAQAPKKEDPPAMIPIQLIIGDETLAATLDATPAGRDFAALLPLELTLKDYVSTERVSDLPRALDTRGAPTSYRAHAGDITYYAPWGNLAIFYRDFRPAPGLVRLGALIGDIAPLKRSGDLRVRIQHSEDENRHGEATQGNKKKLD